jgi:hypothetical protein
LRDRQFPKGAIPRNAAVSDRGFSDAEPAGLGRPAQAAAAMLGAGHIR